MNLKDFIRETLTQIAEGMKEADDAVAKTGGAINPADVAINKSGQGPYAYYADDQRGERRRVVETVEFDIAVTVVDGTETKGGIGVGIGVIGVGSAGKTDKSNTSESRIRFRVPMLFPNSSKA